MKKNLNGKNSKTLTLLSLIFLLAVWCLPTNAAELNTIEDVLSGERIFPGFSILNDDGSTTVLGTTDVGDAVGDLPGRWAVILQQTYPEGEMSGDVLGFFAVGEKGQDAVYGIIAGSTDPTAGTFSYFLKVVDGIGIYQGYVGFGTFSGVLHEATQSIEGDLYLVLNMAETTKFKKDRNNRGQGNPALLLLD